MRKSLRVDIIIGVLIAAWIFLSIRGISRVVINPFETAGYLCGGQRLMSGQRVYLDFFSIYGPMTYYPFGWAQKIFAQPERAAQAVFFTFFAINVFLAWNLARKIAPASLIAIIPVVACFSKCNGGIRLLFALLAMHAMYRLGISGRVRWAGVAGCLAAMNLLLQQDMVAYGLAAVLTAGAVIALQRTPGRKFRDVCISVARAWGSTAGGFLLGSAACLAFIASVSGIGAFMHCAFVVPLKFYDTLHMGTVPALWSVPPLDPGVVPFWSKLGLSGPVRWFIYTIPFYWIPAVCGFTVAWGIWSAWRGKGENGGWHAVMVAAAAHGLFMSRTILRTGDEVKLAFNALPSIMVASGWCWYLWSEANSAGLRRWKTAIASIALTAALTIYATYRPIQDKFKQMLKGFGDAPAEVRASGNEDLAKVARFLKQEPVDQGMFCVPNVPVLYLNTGRKNVTSFDYLDPIIDQEVEGKLMDQLARSRPSHIVVSEDLKFWGQYRFGHEFGVQCARYIASHYTEIFHAGDYRVWRRRDLGEPVPPGPQHSTFFPTP